MRVSEDPEQLNHASIAWNLSLLGAVFFHSCFKNPAGSQENLPVISPYWLILENPSIGKAAGEEISVLFYRQAKYQDS